MRFVPIATTSVDFPFGRILGEKEVIVGIEAGTESSTYSCDPLPQFCIRNIWLSLDAAPCTKAVTPSGSEGPRLQLFVAGSYSSVDEVWLENGPLIPPKTAMRLPITAAWACVREVGSGVPKLQVFVAMS